jgi:hypothetical protein
MFVGIDIGRSAVKAVGPRATWIGPAGVRPGRPSRGPVGHPSVPSEAVTVETGGRVWTLTDHSSAVFDLSLNKTSEGTVLALLGALGRIIADEGETPDEVVVVTGLPAALAETDAEPLTKAVTQAVDAGTTVHTRGRTIACPRRIQLRIHYEGDGIYEAARRTGVMGTDGVVIDMGHVTINIIEYVRGDRFQTYSIPGGGAEVFRRFGAALLRKGLPLMKYSEAHYAAVRVLEGEGIGNIPHREALEILRQEARAYFLESVWPEVRSLLGPGVVLSTVVIAGGAAELFPVGEVFPNAWVLSDPRLQQARGYAALAAEYAREESS